MATLPQQAAATASPASMRGVGGSVVSIRDLKAHCSTCSMRELCLPVGLAPDELKQVDSLIGHRVKLKKGDALYRAGDPFNIAPQRGGKVNRQPLFAQLEQHRCQLQNGVGVVGL